MNNREEIISLWFAMWLQQADLGISDIFTEDVVYIESWGKKYEGRKAVKHWFEEWNQDQQVLTWSVKQFFHKEDQTVVEWYFENRNKTGEVDAFDGMSLIVWTPDNKIQFLKEFGCVLEAGDVDG